MTISVLSTVLLSKYDFTGISSLLGIIMILKNKTVPKPFLKEWHDRTLLVRVSQAEGCR